MTPAHVAMRLAAANAVADNLRATAKENCEKPALAARFIQAAQTIDELRALLEQATFVAKLNHDTIVSRAEA